MSRPQTYEQRILGEADSFLSEIAHTYDHYRKPAVFD